MSTLNFDAASIRVRILEQLQYASNRLEGGFCSDNAQAVAEELARLHAMEIATILDRYSIDTAYDEYLDRAALDFDETRKEGEDDETFRARVLAKIRAPLTGGNEVHYIYWAKQVAGVGGARCVGCWDGPGTVKVVVLSSAGDTPSEEVLQAVRERIAQDRPAGANVTVVGAQPLAVAVTATLSVLDGYTQEAVQAAVADAISSYLTGAVFGDNLSLSYYRVGDLMFGVPGVTDVVDYTVNGGKTSLTATIDQYFALGEVTVNVTP